MTKWRGTLTFLPLEVPLQPKVSFFSKGQFTLLTIALCASSIHYSVGSWLGFTIILRYLLDEEWISEWMDGCMDGHMDGFMDRCMDGIIDGCMDG